MTILLTILIFVALNVPVAILAAIILRPTNPPAPAPELRRPLPMFGVPSTYRRSDG